MLIVGLTGSIGMGKSTAAERFRELGIPVFDADAEVHKLYAGAAVGPIGAAFAGVVVNGGVDRGKLAAQLLADPTRFKELEAIVHPLVQAAEREFLHAAVAQGEKMAVLEIPLLFEAGGAARVDVTVVVSASAAKQRERVLLRPGMTEAKLDAILARQLSDSEKRARADFVVDTSGTIEETRAAIGRIVSSLADRRGTALAPHWQ